MITLDGCQPTRICIIKHNECENACLIKVCHNTSRPLFLFSCTEYLSKDLVFIITGYYVKCDGLKFITCLYNEWIVTIV